METTFISLLLLPLSGNGPSLKHSVHGAIGKEVMSAECLAATGKKIKKTS